MFSAMFESIPYIMLFLIPFDVVLLISGGLFINLSWVLIEQRGRYNVDMIEAFLCSGGL